jgi:hypothetical protein
MLQLWGRPPLHSMNGQSPRIGRPTDCEQSLATAAQDSNTGRPFGPGPLIRRCGRSKERKRTCTEWGNMTVPSNVGGEVGTLWPSGGDVPGESTTLQTQPEHRPLRRECGSTALHNRSEAEERLVGSHGASEMDDAVLQRFAVLPVGNNHWPPGKKPQPAGVSSPPDSLRSNDARLPRCPPVLDEGLSCRW